MEIILQILLLLSCTCLYSSTQGTTSSNQSGQSGQSGKSIYLPDGGLLAERYNVSMFVDPTPESFSYWGSVTMEVMSNIDSNTMLINAAFLYIPIEEIQVVYVNGDALQNFTVDQSNSYMDDESQVLTITVKEQLKSFGTYLVTINFYNGYLDYTLTGFYRSYYYDNTAKCIKWLAVTQAEPAYGRTIFPSLDQPNRKALFVISIGHPENFLALTNAPIVSTEKLQDQPGWVLDHFNSTGFRATYQIEMIVSEFVGFQATLPPNNVVVGFYSRPDVQYQLKFASEIVINALTFFAEYFNWTITFLKFDIAVIPDFQSSGRDALGMVTFRESDALYDPDSSPAVDQANTALVVSHYMAKQWFGNIITPLTWDNVWMKEGFCNYFARIFIDKQFSNWKPMVLEFVVAFIEASSSDGLLAAHPLFFPVEKLTQIDLLYDTQAYRKGSLMARFVSMFVGEKLFQEAMGQFVERYHGYVAVIEFLWDVITATVQSSNVLPDGIDVTTIMKTWINESHYPLLKVELDNQGKVTVSQEAFIFNPDGSGNQNNQCWYLPLVYTTSADLSFDNPSRQWMQCDSVTLDVQLGPNDFLILNVGLTALSCVDYGEPMWERILQFIQYKENYLSLDVFTRAQLYSDVYRLAWIGRVSYNFMFQVFSCLQYETEFSVWRAGFFYLASLRVMLAETDLIMIYMQYARSIAQPIFELFGNINDFPADDPYQTRFKTYFIAQFCSFVAKDCQEQAAQLFQQWFQSEDPYNSNPINPNVRLTAYCQGVVYGGEAEWQFLFQQYQTTIVASEKTAIQRGLGCAQDKGVLRQYLDYSIDINYVRPQDSVVIFAGMATSDASILVARQFFYERFQDIYTVHRGNQVTLGKYITALYARIMSREELQEMENFIETVSEQLASADLRLNEARSMAWDNIQWHDRNYDSLVQFFQLQQSG